MMLDLQTLKETVQHNCHIADAQAAGDYTLCIYLLKMREFYRWENGYNYGDNIPREDVGNWLREREQLWENLQDTDYKKIALGQTEFDPFDTEAINTHLHDQHLVYSAGLGRNTHAHFFLGVLARKEQHHDHDIVVVADEYARDLTSPPAMSQGKQIFIRREAFHRMLWEKYEQWLWNKPANAMARALGYYPFETDLDLALEQMTRNEIDAAVLHEIGEVKVHVELGTAWEELLVQVPHSKLELMLRAARDHYADSLSTLPALLDAGNAASLHFYIANLTHMRKELYPALLGAYEAWQTHNDEQALRKCIQQGERHWGNVCREALEIAGKNPDNFHKPLLDYIESQRL